LGDNTEQQEPKMNTSHLQSLLKTLRNFGPYLLIELLVPGGTLVAILLWLAQNAGRRQNAKARLRPVPRSVATLRVVPSGWRGAKAVKRAASGLLALQKKPHNIGHDRGGALIELRRGQVRDRMGHREELKIRKTPRACHCLPGYFEHIGDDRCGGNAVLFKNDAVEHTARAA
jgi:hypothetical protein